MLRIVRTRHDSRIGYQDDTPESDLELKASLSVDGLVVQAEAQNCVTTGKLQWNNRRVSVISVEMADKVVLSGVQCLTSTAVSCCFTERKVWH